jgi:cyclopropane-fatty-acyl-phospholipid synthase
MGWWDTPDLEALATVAMLNFDVLNSRFGGATLQRLMFMASDRILRANSKQGARRNIRAHYDISNAFYRRWLDETMTYSSALFQTHGESLAAAQNNKYDRLIRATERQDGRLLEIGCGWGGLAERALETTGCSVTGVTISTEQHAYATERLSAAGRSQRADIRLQDYRDIEGQFDAIVSIEMIEAVGMQYWPTYFSAIRQRLAPGGTAALQAITVEDGMFDHYRRSTDFIRRYTFPGGMLISPAQISRQAERAGLRAGNFFRFGRDYARTLRLWSAKFDVARPEFESMGMTQEFLRGWKYYLDTCAAAFELGDHINVVHFELRHA